METGHQGRSHSYSISADVVYFSYMWPVEYQPFRLIPQLSFEDEKIAPIIPWCALQIEDDTSLAQMLFHPLEYGVGGLEKPLVNAFYLMPQQNANVSKSYNRVRLLLMHWLTQCHPAALALVISSIEPLSPISSIASHKKTAQPHSSG